MTPDTQPDVANASERVRRGRALHRAVGSRTVTCPICHAPEGQPCFGFAKGRSHEIRLQLAQGLVTPADTLNKGCPTCGVAAGSGCMRPNGDPMARPHKARVAA